MGDALDLPVTDGPAAEVDTFVGRGALLAQVEGHLRRVRLASLLGPGGVGKTRLAHRVADQLRNSDLCPDGVVVVGLVGIESDRVAARLLRAVGVTDTSDTPLERLVRHLEHQRILLVIDNCEHVLDAAHQVIKALLYGTRHVRVLATSREALGVMGEQWAIVPPMPVTAEPDETGETVADAMALFVDRARARGVEVDPSDPAAVEIVATTGGLPLAVELAASHLGPLSLADVAALITRPRTLARLTRQTGSGKSSMDNALLSSYEPLSADLQRMWALVAQMRGAVPAATVHAVAARLDVAEDDSLAMLVQLCHKSVVQTEHQAEAPTLYSMLEPLRIFTREVTPADELATLRRAHAEHFADLAAHTRRTWYGPTEATTLRELGARSPNLGPALTYLMEVGEFDRAQRMALDVVWSRALIYDQQASEAGRLLGAVLTGLPRSARSRDTACLLGMAAWGCYVQGQLEAGDQLARECDDLLTKLGEAEPPELVLARGTGMWVCEDPEVGQRGALLLLDLAKELIAAGRDSDAALAWLMGSLGAAFHHPDAVTIAREHLAAVQAAGAEWSVSWALWGLALAELRHGDIACAVAPLRTAATIQTRLSETWGLSRATWLAAIIAAHREQHETAAVLFGASHTMHDLCNVDIRGLPGWLMLQQDGQARCVLGLGEERARELEQDGEALTYKEIGPHVLASLDGLPVPANPTGLSPRERLVVELVAQGLTNSEIAGRLNRSESTVAKQVISARKRAAEVSGEQMSNRAHLAAWYQRVTAGDGAPAAEPGHGVRMTDSAGRPSITGLSSQG